MKNRRRTTTKIKTKRPSAPKVRERRKPSSNNGYTKIALLKRERDEALEQQRATSEVLKVISSSPGELEPVFKAVLESALRICEAEFGMLMLYQGDGSFETRVMVGAPPALVDALLHKSFTPPPGNPLDRMLRTKKTVHVIDAAAEKGKPPSARLAGARSHITVPMIKQNEVVGSISIYRTEVRPFTDKQIELVTNFAAQAAIAIENTRLLNELRQRTTDLTESLEQQTATSEVLKVISSSPGELEPVFNAMLANAVRICGARFGTLFLFDGDKFHTSAYVGAPQVYIDFQNKRGPFVPPLGAPLAQLLQTKQVVRTLDMSTHHTPVAELVEYAGTKSHIAVPMLRDNSLVGAILIYNQEVQPFTDKQVELVQNFAAQAVIAIENTRLLNELRESLEQQTATSEVLGVISSSPGDLEPVFQAMMANATRICEAKFGILQLHENGKFRNAAMFNPPPALAEYRHREPVINAGPQSAIGRVAATKQLVHIVDYAADPAYIQRDPAAVNMVERAGARTVLLVPMLKDGEHIGNLNIYRQEVRPFTDKQIALVQNFAAQAVIAIENTRLLSELRESLQQQTATADVLRVISSSPGELEPVFTSILDNATRICQANFGTLFLREGEALRVAAHHGSLTKAWDEQWRVGMLLQPDGELQAFQTLSARQPIQVTDLSKAPSYLARNPKAVNSVEIGGIRTMVTVPMLKDGEAIGVITIFRIEIRELTDKQIALVTNFAAQAVIAIENTRLLNELRESLEQQTATSEVLSVISSSPGELEPVFQAMLENAVRICDAKFGILFRYENEAYDPVALFGLPPALEEFLRQQRGSFQPIPGSMLDRIRHDKSLSHTADYAAEATPGRAVTLGGARSTVDVPMLKDNVLVGVISVYRQEVRPFIDKQIALLQNFAAQAVIAIENTRLLNELRQRTDDLTESLEQQTATSEVLQVISISPGELQPVFDTMLAKATELCEASYGALWLREGDALRNVAFHGLLPANYTDQWRAGSMIRLDQDLPAARAMRLGAPVQVADMRDDTAYLAGHSLALGSVDFAGIRTLIAVPMFKEGEFVGAIVIYRREVRPFTDKQIALVQNFAAQAVIAIENTRLLSELRESLEQQTATSEVLQVISKSPGDLEPVFKAMLENATRICEAKFGNLFRFDGSGFQLAAEESAPPELIEFLRQQWSHQPLPGSLLDRVMRTKQPCHTADITADAIPSPGAKFGGARSAVCVPMLKDDLLVGAIFIYRTEVWPFTDKQIALVQNFAAQAVIAIENTRLLNELRQRTDDLSESLEQQTAIGDILRVISHSPSDVQPVLDSVAEHAARICEAQIVDIIIAEDNVLRIGASFGDLERNPGELMPLNRSTVMGRSICDMQPVQVADLQNAGDDFALGREFAVRFGHRSILAVPLIREACALGTILVRRTDVRAFEQKDITLLTTFADQAAIAIENVRLFDEIQDKSRQLEVASQHKSQFLANMSHELRTPLNAILGYTELMADGIYGQLPEKTMGVLKRLESNGRHLLGLINDVLDLSKIEAGQLTLDLSDYSLEDIAQTVRSTLEPLAADKKLALKVEVAAKMPAGHGDGRRLTQVLINLVGNAIKFTDAGEVVIMGGATDGSFHLSVRDTGPGISAADQAKLFQEFQQADNAITRKKGGTGLGLAISKRIIEMHGGKIWLESQVGQGSTFSFTVPVRVAQQVLTA